MAAVLRPAERRAYEANIGKLYLYTFLMNFQLWWPLWVVYLQEMRGLSLTQITALDAPFWLVIVAAQVPTGAIADRWGRKWSLLLGAASFTAGILLFGLASNYILILISYLGWGVALTFQQGADSALLFDSLKALGREDEFERITGRSVAVMSAAGLGGILLGTRFAAVTDLATPIVASGVIAALALPVALSLKEPPIAEHERSASYAHLLRDSLAHVRQRPAVLRMLVFAAVIGVSAFGPIIFVQPFLRSHGVGLADLGDLQAPNRVLAIVAALAAYRASGRFGTRALYASLPVVMVLSYVLLGAWGSVYAYVAFFPISAMQGLQQPLIGNYINQRIPSGQRATILSLRQLLFSLALAPAEPLLGYVADEWGLPWVFWSLAATTAVLGAITLVWWLRAEDAGPLESAEPERPPAVAEVERAG